MLMSGEPAAPGLFVAFIASAILAESAVLFAREVVSASRGGRGSHVETLEIRPSTIQADEKTPRRFKRLRRLSEEPWVIITTLSGCVALVHYAITYWPKIKPWLFPLAN
jgi:hypothetical protein